MGKLGEAQITTANNAGFTLGSGAKLAPGDAFGTTGTLTVNVGTGNFDISAGVSGANSEALAFDLGAAGAGLSDIVSLTSGTLKIGTGELDFSDFRFATSTGFGVGTYTLFDTTTAIDGTLGSNLSGLLGAYNGTLSFANGGDDLVLTVTNIPEPSTYALMAGGLGLLCLLRKRSHKPSSRNS